MKTDMLSWTKLNPTVKQLETKKKFFGKYLFKAVVYCPGGRIILNTTGISVDELVKARIEFGNNIRYNYGGSWGFAARNDSFTREFKENANVDQLEKFKNLKSTNQDIKLRVEEPFITVYCNDENELFNVVNQNYPERVREVYRPSSTNAKEALDRGEVILKKNINYNFKIQFRSHMFRDVSVKHQIYDYLYALENEIKLTKNTGKELLSNSQYFPGGYFYSKDMEIATFISLICPYLISGIYKVVYIDS